MFYIKKPKDFYPKISVVICYLIYKNQILLLKRKNNKVQANLWTAPGGKKEKNETAIDGVIREVFEETGIKIEKNNLIDTGIYYIKNPIVNFEIQIFKTHLQEKPKFIILSESEHDKYEWVDIDKVLNYPLIDDGDNCLKNTFFNKHKIEKTV